MAASGRSTMAVRAFLRATQRVSPSPRPSLPSPFLPPPQAQARISSTPLRLLRRELSSFRPLHSAIASACLVSKLPNDVDSSSDGRFANYLSPI
ncbi:hypothetical protein F8388_023726 [Cannabis sativa]|uniref:Uncharacterized protein n=1 Tax=Cannabis sativa TaxID=3483 RepID=A0A7J6H098_CANSA|nr:hypothetical protein F8388_023726 [Cannabis sativa]KAF4388652.1 hypothetical protein G4B88_018929 [Cannabis sativa]